MNKIRLFAFISSLFLFSCAPSGFITVSGPTGQKRAVPTPTKFITFQGRTAIVKGVTVTLEGGATGGVGEMDFSTKFRDASDFAIILDNSQYRDSQQLIASASVLNDQDFNKRLAAISDDQRKLDQLALIASVKDSDALQKWISTYFLTNTAEPRVANVPAVDTEVLSPSLRPSLRP